MSRQRTQLSTALRRVAVGLLAFTTPILLAPQALASPDTDANDAITAAWNAAGADTGPLGPPDGGVYPVGDGFGQNFAGGKIYFTPATGAHSVQGAILEKYQSLGGPADSDLGFPTIDEGAGRLPDSRNSTFSAADNPVIFWTPATGARVVRGAINAAWDKLDGSAGVLGAPLEDETYRGDEVTQKFTGGEVTWNRKTKSFTTVPPELAGQLTGLQVPQDATSAINAARRAAGGPLGPLGTPQSGQYQIGADGAGQDFAGGKIFYSPATGANVVTGQVLSKYESVGGPQGDLGFPTSSEVDGGLGANSRMSTFAAKDQPVIFWTPDYGAVIVRGAMNAAWAKLGGATGPMGAPVADQSENGNVISQRFSGGVISWDRTANKFTTEPANLVGSLAGLQVPGVEAPKAPTSPPASSGADEGKWFVWHWNWWWLLAVIPVLLLAGLVVGAVMWSQRRTRGDAPKGDRFAAAPSFEAGNREPETVGAGGPWGFHGDEPETTPNGAPVAAHFAADDNSDDVDTAPTRVEVPEFAEPALTGPHDEPAEEPMAEPITDADAADEESVVEPVAEPVVDADAADEESVVEPVAEPVVDADAADEESVVEPVAEPVDDADAADEEPVQESAAEEAEEEPAEDLTEEDVTGGAVDEAAATTATEDDEGREDQGAATPVAEPPSRALVDDAPSARHAAGDVDEPVLDRPSLRLSFDPDEVPEGYPIKADTKSGLYWSPDSEQYDEAPVEIWFVSEEFARANGFAKAD